MAGGQLGATIRQVGRLFGTGTVAGYTEAQLLSRFVQSKDETAFEALLQRFGPMVLGICRQSLKDPQTVDDAFQATFLVFVRRAHTIRDPALLGNWLYGVAVKVARRARADAYKRQKREKGGVEAMAEIVGDDNCSRNPDLGPLLHEELERLPPKYRLPIVLCFLEGDTHEQAAELLGWPVGTVKGRVARAKNLLRDRLTRRGVTVSTAVLAASLSQAANATVPQVLLDQTMKAATGIAAGGAVAAGLASAGAHALSDGVLTTMAISKLKFLLGGVLLIGLSSTGAAVLAQRGLETDLPRQEQVTQVAKPSDLVASPLGTNDESRSPSANLGEFLNGLPKVGTLPPLKDLAKTRIEAAKRRLESQAASYQDGTITIDRYLDAASRYMEARMEHAEDAADRLQAAEDNVRLHRAIVKREEAKFAAGVAAVPNVSEAVSSLADAEVALYKLRNGEVTPARVLSSVRIEEDADDKARNDLIRDALNKPLSFPFANETPLEDVIKYVVTSTQSPELEKGIPIYVDPVGLTEVEKTLASPVIFSLEGVKAKTGLRLMLKQLDLGYYVREGLLTITASTSEDYKDATDPDWREREQAELERQTKLGGGGAGGGVGGASGSGYR